MTSRALWGGAIAFFVAVVVVGGTLAGSAIASRRSAQAAEVAVATYQAEAAKPGRARTEAGAGRAAPAATAERVSLAGQSGPPRPGVVGVVLDVTANEITVKSRQGPTLRLVIQPGTVIRKRGQRIDLAEVRPRDRLVAVGRPNQQQRTLQPSIVVVDPPRPFRAGR
jgi:hypothetical protein